MFRQQQYARSFGRGGRLALPLVFIAVLLSFLAPTPVGAQPTGYQEYYVLGHEEHVWRAFVAINDGDASDPPGNICSTVSLVATTDYQVVYYDHWEDGYEADILNPTQDTTKIYGDGVTGNGGTDGDLLLAGDEINLTSDQNITGTAVITGYVPVAAGRDQAYIRYDGGDRLLTSGGPVDLTHAMWPINDSWIGGAWEVYSRQAYADAYSYRLPIGQDLYDLFGGDTGPYGDFRDVYIQLGAFEDHTTISIDNVAGDVVNLILDRGQSYFSMGYINSAPAPAITINSGTIVRSNEPIQVGVITGADGNFQGRFFNMLPDQKWGADYIVPVPRGYGRDDDDGYQDAPAEIYLANPNDFPIEIQAYDAVTQTSFVIGPTGNISATTSYSQMRGGSHAPQGSAARFTSSDGVFGVVVCADTSRIDYDWGFAGIPAKYLTQDYYVSWAPGNYYCPHDPNCTTYSNGSPVWVTPLVNDTTFYVDYSPLDGLVDETFTLDVLAQQRISDTIDNDNTGMHVWATDKFAIAWGEDPRSADASDPYLDLGFAMLPLQQRWLDPVLTLDKTAEPTTLLPGGGIVTFTLVAQAYIAPLVNVDITDTLPLSWTYVSDSARIVYPHGGAESLEPEIDAQTLYWNLAADLDLNQSLTLTFQAQITATDGVDVSVNHAQVIGEHEYSGVFFNPTDEATIYISQLGLTKSVDKAQAGISDTLVYALSYVNRSDSITVTNVMLRDTVPVQYVTFGSASDGGNYDSISGAITWMLAPLGPGIGGTVEFTVTVNSFVENGTVIENVGYIEGDQAAKAGSNVARTTVLAPDVKFTKSGPTAAYRGNVITYTLAYENVGGVAATEVVISDTIPLSTTYVPGSLAINTGVGWVALTDASGDDQGTYISPTLVITPDIVAAGEAGQIRFSVQLDSDLPSSSLIMNSATLDRRLDMPRESNLAVTHILDLVIGKSAEQEAVAPGDVISYTLTYENLSETVTQTEVYALEPIPDYTSLISVTESGGNQVEYSWDNGATWTTTLPIAPVTHIRWYDVEMPPGDQVTVGFAVRVNDVLPPNTTIKNMARVRSAEVMDYFGAWVSSNPVEVETVDLWVDKSANQPLGQPGGLISYTISYGNHGSADAFGVRITDTVPVSTAYGAGSIWGAGADDSGDPLLTWDVMTVTAGASAQQVGYTVVLDGSLQPGDVITNTAALSSAFGVETSDAEVVIAGVDLAIAKAAVDLSSAPLYPGDVLEYRVVVTNSDVHYSHYNVAVSDELPTYTTPVTGSVGCSPGAVCGQSGDLVTATVASLDPGGVLTLTFQVTVDPGTSGYTITNRADAVSEQQSEPTRSLTTTNVVTTALPSMTLSKWMSPHASERPDTWTEYYFRVANTGDVPLNAVQIWDDQISPLVGPLHIPDLSVGETYTATRWWPVYLDVCNVATATAHVTGFAGTVQATAAACYDFIEGLSLALDVSVQPAMILHPQIVTYTYHLTNTGNDWLEGGTISDTVYGDIVTALTLAPGESYTCILTQPVTVTTVNVASAWGTDRLGAPVSAVDSAKVFVASSRLYLPLIAHRAPGVHIPLPVVMRDDREQGDWLKTGYLFTGVPLLIIAEVNLRCQ